MFKYIPDETQVMTTDCYTDLMILCDEAEKYLNGKRAQMDMFVDTETEESVSESV